MIAIIALALGLGGLVAIQRKAASGGKPQVIGTDYYDRLIAFFRGGGEGLDLPSAAKARLSYIITEWRNRNMAGQVPAVTAPELIEVIKLSRGPGASLNAGFPPNAWQRADDYLSGLALLIGGKSFEQLDPATLERVKPLLTTIAARMKNNQHPAVTPDQIQAFYNIISSAL